MSKSIGVAVCGTGNIAQTMISAMRHVDGLRPMALVSRDPARAASLAAELDIPASYGSVHDALADPHVDALYIGNDSAAHADAAIAGLERDKAVLVEKPFALDAASGKAVIATARRTGRLFMEAIATPFIPAVRSALDRVAAGTLGNVALLTADFGYPATRESLPGGWGPGGGVLLDRAIYPVMLARLALGPVATVDAVISRDTDGVDVDASLLLRHRGGAASQLSASFTSQLGNLMTIAGSAGSVQVRSPLLTAERLLFDKAAIPQRAVPSRSRSARLRQNPLLRRAAAMVRSRRIEYFSFGPSIYIHELVHFRDLFRSGATQSPVLTFEVSLDVMRILDEARAKSG